MGHPLDDRRDTRAFALLRVELLQQSLDKRPIADVNLEQFIPDLAAQFRHVTLWFQPQLFEEDFTRQRIAVGVESARRQPDDCIPWPDGFPIEHSGFFHYPDNRPAHIIFALLIEARHLRRLAPDQGATVFSASAREAF